MKLKLRQKTEIRQKQKLKQKVEVKLTLAQKVEQTIKQAVITPSAVCPECSYEMDENEIRNGWRQDQLDTTTQCPECGHRFEATLLVVNRVTGRSHGAHSYLCVDQLFYRLRKVRRGKSKRLGKVFLEEKHPGLLWNMVRHFGTYENALKKFKNN